MTLQPQSTNGATLSRLRRTLTLPINKMKSRSNSFKEGDKIEDNGEIIHTGSAWRNRPERGGIFSSMQSPSECEHEIRVNKPETKKVSRRTNKITKADIQHIGATAQQNDESDLVVASKNASKVAHNLIGKMPNDGKTRRKRAKRWPQTLARVLERFSSQRKTHHTAAVLRTIIVPRKTGESLGIYLKEVPVFPDQNIPNTSDQNQADTNDDITFHQHSSILISRLELGCAVEKQGILRNGDEVLFVNHKDISKKSVQEVAAMMDHEQHLVLSVRSKHLQINNNNEKESTSLCKCEYNLEDSSGNYTHISDISDSTLPSENFQVPEYTLTSSNINHNNSREAGTGIPSVYDNNFSSVYSSVSSAEDLMSRPKDKVQIEYDEALQILMKAISSFEKPDKVSSSSRPKSYWNFINGIISDNAENSWTAGAKSENEDCSAFSDSTNTSLSNTPQFPSVSELPVFSDPEYDDVATSEIGEDGEVQVDGSARLFLQRTNSSSSNASASLHISANNSSHSSQSRDDNQSRSLTVLDSSKINNSLLTTSEPQNIACNVTVRQRRDWLDKRKEVNVNVQPNVRVDAEVELPESDLSLIQNTIVSDHSCLKTSSESLSASACTITLPQAQLSKTFWNRVTSPPRLRKNKLGRKISKRIKKIGSSEGETTDPSSTGSMKDSSTIFERYHLEVAEEQRRLSSLFLPDNRPHDSSIKPLNLSEFRKYKPISPTEEKYSQTPIKGSLVITLYGARDIKKTVSEVYCIAQIDDDVKHRIRTRMQPCRGSVAWNDCYEAKLEDAYELHITLYTWESHGKHKTLAKSTLPVADLLCGLQSKPVKLAVKLEPRGTLYVKLSVEDPMSMAGPKVFGADLQSILDREESGLNIPLIVNDCIKEVEARGMSIVGIYRLCGSAIAKRELRKKYEDDRKSVNLSQENYPDINVITGILKDFLRELPQPLFPPELLEAVTVAMEKSTATSRVPSVSSPFDPTPIIDFPEVKETTLEACVSSGRRSALIELLEVERKVTLPPAERATLYALLNHLKKVSTNQTMNKMTCQNLAVCFGPVLLGSIGIGPSKGLDLTAAIGFKRHIQVLNYMVSNWPSRHVPLLGPDDICLRQDVNTGTNDDDKSSLKKINRVSLTRRISYIFPSQNGSNHSSNSGSSSIDAEMRSIVFGKQILNNSRKSGSLTNILESTDIPMERIFDEDGYFQQDDIDQDILLQCSSNGIMMK